VERDVEAVKKAEVMLEAAKNIHNGPLSQIPDELVNPLPHSINRLSIYGMSEWGEIFTPRQGLALITLARLVQKHRELSATNPEKRLSTATQACLALVFDKEVDKLSTLARWDTSRENPQGAFGRQALTMVWDFNESESLFRPGWTGILH
jgi:adenine-specific DNA methylase